MFSIFNTWLRACSVSISTVVLVLALTVSTQTIAEHDSYSTGDEKYQMGKKVFANYCSRCHGEHADGRSAATPLYIKMGSSRPSNFRMKFFSTRPKNYMANVVRDGGEKHSLSQYMPPFGEELSNGEINNVVYFIQKFSSNVASELTSDTAVVNKGAE